MILDRLLICLTLLLVIATPADAKRTERGKASKAAAAKKMKPVKQEPLPADSQALLQNKLADIPRNTMACEGAFARDATHDKLAAAFGAKNVLFKSPDPENGSSDKATVLFDDDPTRRAVVYWRDATARANPLRIEVGAPSTWIGPGGIHNGLPLKAVEDLNGGSFKLMGFEGKAPGLVTTLNPSLATPPGGCTITVRFEPGVANPLPPRFAAITGDKEIASSHPLMKRARPQISEWTIVYR